MKRVILNFLVIVAFVVSATFTSCSTCGCDDFINDEAKLMEAMIYHGSGIYQGDFSNYDKFFLYYYLSNKGR